VFRYSVSMFKPFLFFLALRPKVSSVMRVMSSFE
jgi:hypothetical protein